MAQSIGVLDDHLHALSPWMLCFAVIDFDLEYGQKLESTFPHVDFHPQELSNICFHSFPDCNIENEADSVFVFRVRQVTTPTGEENALDDTAITKNENFLYGFSFFRQKKDPTNKRGYLQKSVVLITTHPFIGLFKKLVSLVGPMFFEFGESLLESTFQNVSAWPDPRVGHTYDLAVLGSILTYHIPHSLFPYLIDSRYARPSIHSKDDELISNIHSINLFFSFRNFVEKLWTLWELVLIGEPILLLSPSPVICSEAVLCLVSLISPLTFNGDFRPYFTIHDSDFNTYTETSEEHQSVIIGATNPFFLKAMEHWPHILTVGFSKILKGNFGNTKQELKTLYKASTPPDGSIVKQLRSLGNKSKEDIKKVVYHNNEILRRHFVEKTEQFISPLERYFNQFLMPRKTDLNPLQAPKIRPFNQIHFLDLLSKKSPLTPVAFKKKQRGLYKRFFRSKTFLGWLKEHNDVGNSLLQDLYIKRVIECDVKQCTKWLDAVQVIDFFMRIREHAELVKGENDADYQALILQQEQILEASDPSLQQALRDFIV